MVGASLAILVLIAFSPHVSDQLRGFSSLALGSGLAIAATRSSALTRWLGRPLVAPVAVGLAASFYVFSITVGSSFLWNMGIGAASAVMIAGIWHNAGQPLARFLALPPLAWAGRLTYAVYLIQTLAINAVWMLFTRLGVSWNWLGLFVASYAVAIAAGWVARMVLEKPMINLGKALAAGRPVEDRRASRRPLTT